METPKAAELITIPTGDSPALLWHTFYGDDGNVHIRCCIHNRPMHEIYKTMFGGTLFECMDCIEEGR